MLPPAVAAVEIFVRYEPASEAEYEGGVDWSKRPEDYEWFATHELTMKDFWWADASNEAP